MANEQKKVIPVPFVDTKNEKDDIPDEVRLGKAEVPDETRVEKAIVSGDKAAIDMAVVTQGPADDGVVNHGNNAMVAPVTVLSAVASGSEKLVSVKALEDHDCTIGINHIVIVKGKDYKLPEGAVAILANSGVVMRK